MINNSPSQKIQFTFAVSLLYIIVAKFVILSIIVKQYVKRYKTLTESSQSVQVGTLIHY